MTTGLISGSKFSHFKREMENIFINLADAAVHWSGLRDTPPELSAYLKTDTGNGWVFGIGDNEATDPEIRELARQMHDRIQQLRKSDATL